jgi:uncharacterized protein YneF (UPF0154 family)
METYQSNTNPSSHFVRYTIVFITLVVLGTLGGSYLYFDLRSSSSNQDMVEEIDNVPLSDEEISNALDSVNSIGIKPSVAKSNQTLDKMQKPKFNVGQKSISNALESLE